MTAITFMIMEEDEEGDVWWGGPEPDNNGWGVFIVVCAVVLSITLLFLAFS